MTRADLEVTPNEDVSPSIRAQLLATDRRYWAWQRDYEALFPHPAE